MSSARLVLHLLLRCAEHAPVPGQRAYPHLLPLGYCCLDPVCPARTGAGVTAIIYWLVAYHGPGDQRLVREVLPAAPEPTARAVTAAP